MSTEPIELINKAICELQGKSGVPAWEAWAKDWVAKKDRTTKRAAAIANEVWAAEAAAEAAAETAEAAEAADEAWVAARVARTFDEVEAARKAEHIAKAARAEAELRALINLL
jgi:hypothetical protein